MASVRAMLIVSLLVCMIMLRSGIEAANVKSIPTIPTLDAASDVKSQIKCALNNKTCRPGDQAPENQEEEVKAVNVASSSLPIDNDYDDDDELPGFEDRLEVLGH